MHRKTLTAVLVALALFAVATTASALPRCYEVCTITCPCETPCILFGNMQTTCAEWACDPDLSHSFNSNEAPMSTVDNSLDALYAVDFTPAPAEQAADR